jgi:hypothetical protein
LALSDLTLRSAEHYGGIDLKRNYRKYFSGGLSISVGLHLLILLLYVGYNWLTSEATSGPRITYTDVFFFPPPPSVTKDIEPPSPIDAPRPGAEVKPNFGVPVAVPEAVGIKDIMPITDVPIGTPGNPDDGLQVSDNGSPVRIDVPAQPSSAVLDKTVFVDYSEACRLSRLCKAYRDRRYGHSVSTDRH